MSSLREAAQRALEALESSTPKPRAIDDDYAEQGWKDHSGAITALRAALAEPVQAPSEEQAYSMGAMGGKAHDADRRAFEAWMRGHCWALCATWDGKQYRSDAEQGGDVDPRAMRTRQLWAAWRDRAALANPGFGA